jgi:large subunit ribosomal protein L9
MSKAVEVILIKDIKGKGKLGQTKAFPMGYVRNFLLPQGLALLVTPNNLKKFESIKKKEVIRLQKEKANAETLKASLDKKAISLTRVAHEKGTLYGSVSLSDIIDLIHQNFSIKVDKKCFGSIEHIKEAGEYDIEINFHPEVTCVIKLTVIAQNKKEDKKDKEA